MIPTTAQRHPVDVSDPIIQLLLTNASPDLTAPPRPRIVNHRCGKSLGEKESFDALHYLTILYAAVGRTDFTAAEIHRYAPGIGKSRIPTYLRSLCDKGLVDVTGHREIKGLASEFWTAYYKIDLDRLRKESALIVLHDLRTENLPPPLRPAHLLPEQTVLKLEAAPAPTEVSSRTPREPAPTEVSSRTPRELEAAPAPTEVSSRTPRELEAAPAPTEVGSRTLRRTAADLPEQPYSQENGYRPPRELVVASVATENGSHAPRRTATVLPEAAMLPEERLPFSQGIVGGRSVGMDVGTEVRVSAARSLTPDDLHQLISGLRPALYEMMAEINGGATFTPPSAEPALSEPIPPAPTDEPALHAGPITIWGNLIGRVTPPNDIEKIRSVIQRFEKPSNGHSSYWLARAMAHVAVEEPASLTINYVAGVLRRMQERNDWSTAEMCRKLKEQRAESSAAPTGVQPSVQIDRVPRGKAAVAPAHEVAPTVAPLPAELEQHWVLTTWRHFAGSNVAMTVTRAQQLIVRVTDRPAWEAVLSNWNTRYKAKANWFHFDGLLERYDREVAAGDTRNAPANSDNGYRISGSLIDYHPALEKQELRKLWYARYHEAMNKAAKQAVLRRLLAEHPLEPEMLAKFMIPVESK